MKEKLIPFDIVNYLDSEDNDSRIFQTGHGRRRH